MKSKVTQVLLWMLNLQWLNATPCKYAFVGNLDNFSEDHLRSEIKERPEMTIKTLLEEAELFRSCPLRSGGEFGFSVIEGGEIRDATMWDAHDLRTGFAPRKEDYDGDD